MWKIDEHSLRREWLDLKTGISLTKRTKQAFFKLEKLESYK